MQIRLPRLDRAQKVAVHPPAVVEAMAAVARAPAVAATAALAQVAVEATAVEATAAVALAPGAVMVALALAVEAARVAGRGVAPVDARVAPATATYPAARCAPSAWTK
jgi:hypothetical protein